MFNFLNKLPLKLKIIVALTIINLAIVASFSTVSYYFIRDLYFNQLNSQIKSVSEIISKQIDVRYLNALQIGIPTSFVENYFFELLNKNSDSNISSEIFIFDSSFTIIVHSDINTKPPRYEPKLLLNRKEILELKTGNFITTYPFKGEDNNWYLWGFKKLNKELWLALRGSAERLTDIEKLKTLFLIIGFSGMIITLLFAVILANSITKPIDRLIEFSNQIGKGNFTVSLPNKMQSEFATLAGTMEKMKNDILQKNKEKENMLAQIAHEIRNPLGGIELLTCLAKEDLEKAGKQTEYLEKTLKEIQSLKKLISSFLDFSRPQPPNFTYVDIENLLIEIEKLFLNEIQLKNASLKFNIRTRNILFDYEHLKFILINLLVNSLESIESGGKIIVETFTENNAWNIIVDDNGKGISTELREKIFEPFFSTKKNGTGLGLAIVKKLCGENDAFITIEEKSENGTRFLISKESKDEY